MAKAQITLVASCLFGLEHLLGGEIDALGYERIKTIDGRVYFKGPLEAIAECCLWLRYAERLYLLLGSFRAESFSQLYDGTRALPLSEWIGPEDAFPVKGHAIKSRLFSIPDCQKIVKKAAVDALGAEYGITHFEETGAKFQIEFFILRDEADIMIDLCGTPLHKRGYRAIAGEAPLRETLAAAVAATARPREDVLFWDPFCGSGTIAIEAAMQMNHIAPGLGRTFAAEAFDSLPRELFDRARRDAREQRRSSEFEAYASDIDPKMVELAKKNAQTAGVADCIRIFCRDALSIEMGGRRGTVVCNPPYGERMMSPEQVRVLYRRMGEHFATLDRWQIYILTAAEDFEMLYGRRADKRRRLYNGMLRCELFQYFKNGDRNAPGKTAHAGKGVPFAREKQFKKEGSTT